LKPGKWTAFTAVLGIVATALFYGDAIITPAVSVLSAVEGLTVAPGLCRSGAADLDRHPDRPVRDPVRGTAAVGVSRSCWSISWIACSVSMALPMRQKSCWR
jgi:hypothetical protein